MFPLQNMPEISQDESVHSLDHLPVPVSFVHAHRPRADTPLGRTKPQTNDAPIKLLAQTQENTKDSSPLILSHPTPLMLTLSFV